MELDGDDSEEKSGTNDEETPNSGEDVELNAERKSEVSEYRR
jgi:hypothetical protein